METISKPCGGVEDCLSMIHLALSLLKKILKILSFLLLGFIHTLPFSAVNCWFLTSLHLIISSGFGPPIAGNGLPMQLPKIQILHVPYPSMPHTCQSMQTFLPKFSRLFKSIFTEVGCSAEFDIYNTLQLPYNIKNDVPCLKWLSSFQVPTANILRTGSPNIARSSCCATARSFAVRTTHPLVSSALLSSSVLEG
jgi:hypothetical protein